MKKENLLENKKVLGIIGVTVILAFFGGMYLKDGKDGSTGNSIFTEGKVEKIELNGKKESKETGTKKESDSKKETNEGGEETEIVVDIKGEVKNPGVYTLANGSIVEDLIKKAGGITKDGTLQNINRAQVLKPNEAIVIANKKDIDKDVAVGNDNSLNTTSNGVGEKETGKKGSLININTASVEELKTLNGIGDSKAEAIISYREEKGGFKKIEEIQNVSGIGKATFEKLKDKICV
ncbi:MAG: helix-hairpin-helix domain-containing protein [Clostridium sp.]|uniref:helix-hairpin-helix domain-containing protein n=1 Tax=Clostridium sp. TaxID=1506 RepID=UPI003F3F9500